MTDIDNGDDDRHRGPLVHPARAAVLILAGIVLGILLVSKTGTVNLATASSTSTTNAGAASTTTSVTTSNPPARGSSTTGSATPAKPAGQVRIVVANATATAGAAGRIGSELATIGYSNEKAANATSHLSTTAVYYAPGFEPNAVAIVSFLQLKTPAAAMPASPPVSSVQGVDVLVVVGPDLAASANSSSSAPSPATSHPLD